MLLSSSFSFLVLFDSFTHLTHIVTCDSCSPFKFRVLPTHDASKVRASGPGLSTGLPASLPVEFTIDAKDAGEGQLSVQITVSVKTLVLMTPTVHSPRM